jgi:hypothetical protein
MQDFTTAKLIELKAKLSDECHEHCSTVMTARDRMKEEIDELVKTKTISCEIGKMAEIGLNAVTHKKHAAFERRCILELGRKCLHELVTY